MSMFKRLGINPCRSVGAPRVRSRAGAAMAVGCSFRVKASASELFRLPFQTRRARRSTEVHEGLRYGHLATLSAMPGRFARSAIIKLVLIGSNSGAVLRSAHARAGRASFQSIRAVSIMPVGLWSDVVAGFNDPINSWHCNVSGCPRFSQWPALCPPSTWRIFPVTKLAVSRYMTASTIS